MSDQEIQPTDSASGVDPSEESEDWVTQDDFSRDASGERIPFRVRAFNALCQAIKEAQRTHPSPLSLPLLKYVRITGSYGHYSINRADFVTTLLGRDHQEALAGITNVGRRSIEAFCSYVGVDYALGVNEHSPPQFTLIDAHLDRSGGITIIARFGDRVYDLKGEARYKDFDLDHTLHITRDDQTQTISSNLRGQLRFLDEHGSRGQTWSNKMHIFIGERLLQANGIPLVAGDLWPDAMEALEIVDVGQDNPTYVEREKAFISSWINWEQILSS